MRGAVLRGGLIAAAGLLLTACATPMAFQDALWTSATDGSVICPSSNDCPAGPGGVEYSGMVIPADIVADEVYEDGVGAATAMRAAERPPQIVCVAGERRKGCPKGYNGRLWKPGTDQITCRPGDTNGPCAAFPNSYSFWCLPGAGGGGYCPGVPHKEKKRAAGR